MEMLSIYRNETLEMLSVGIKETLRMPMQGCLFQPKQRIYSIEN